MVVIALALLAASLSALSAAGEQRAAFRLAAARRGRLHPERGTGTLPSAGSRVLLTGRLRRRLGYAAGFATALLSSPLWLGSWATDAASFVAQSTALHLGSLSRIQLLMVTTLLFSLPLAAMGTGRRPLPRDWIGALLVCGGLMLVLSTRAPSPSGPPREVALAAAMVVVLALAAVLVGSARGRPAPVRAAFLAAAAGALFSAGAATTKLAASTLTTEGIGGLLTSWAGYWLAAVSLVGFALQQAAFAAGPLAPAVTAVVIVDPLVSYVLGAVGFAESPPVGGLLVLVVLGMLVVSVGVAVLARSPLLVPVRDPVALPDSQPAPEGLPSRTAPLERHREGDGVRGIGLRQPANLCRPPSRPAGMTTPASVGSAAARVARPRCTADTPVIDPADASGASRRPERHARPAETPGTKRAPPCRPVREG